MSGGLCLFLVRGLPGSGKSTFAKLIVAQMDSFGENPRHFEADDFFLSPKGNYVFDPTLLMEAHADCRRKTAKALSDGYDVVVSNTFTTRAEIWPYAELASHYGARLFVITMNGNFGSIHDVPKKTIERMKARWESWP